jgi:hypothetical protein
MRNTIRIAVVVVVAALAVGAAAQDIETVPCLVISAVWSAFSKISLTLIGIMFLYGGAKYAYSADDPGGRKQGKNICIHAIIGAILIGLVIQIKDLLVPAANICPGMTF